jgi:hypothetical protein
VNNAAIDFRRHDGDTPRQDGFHCCFLGSVN